MKEHVKTEILEKVNFFFENNNNKLYYLSLGLCVLFSLLLFSLKISIGADDSEYILSAVKYHRGEAFPEWHGSFYQIFLSFWIWLFGVNLLLLKLLSLIFIVLHLVVIRKTFLNRLPHSILAITLLFVSVNVFVLEYASLTYSEALYFLIQGLCIMFLLGLFEKLEKEGNTFKYWVDWLVLGLALFLLSITRNIGVSMFLAVIVFWGIQKKWKSIISILLSFSFFETTFLLYKGIFWGSSKLGAESQFGAMFLKDPYNPAFGKVGLGELLERFYINFNQYITQHIFVFFGLDSMKPGIISAIVAIACAILFIMLIVYIFDKNKLIAFIGLYVVIALGVTFISQQSFWNQGRLVLVYVPLIFIFLLSVLHVLFSKYKNQFVRHLPIIIGCMFTLLVFKGTIIRAKENCPIIAKNISGDMYYGYSDDWANYLKISNWAAKNLSDSVNIGCRKPTMSFVYGEGRYFEGIYQAPISPMVKISKKTKDSILLINIKDIFKKLDPEEQDFFCKNIEAVLIRTKSNMSVISPKLSIGIITLNAQNKEKLFSVINNYKLPHVQGLEGFLKVVNAEKCYFAYPDSMLQVLKEKKIDYLIDAKLKVDMDDTDSKRFVTTIKQFVVIIAYKYPDFFEIIRKEGKEEDESILYKLHWEKI